MTCDTEEKVLLKVLNDCAVTACIVLLETDKNEYEEQFIDERRKVVSHIASAMRSKLLRSFCTFKKKKSVIYVTYCSINKTMNYSILGTSLLILDVNRKNNPEYKTKIII